MGVASPRDEIGLLNRETDTAVYDVGRTEPILHPRVIARVDRNNQHTGVESEAVYVLPASKTSSATLAAVEEISNSPPAATVGTENSRRDTESQEAEQCAPSKETEKREVINNSSATNGPDMEIRKRLVSLDGASAPSNASFQGGGGFGITYSPYTSGPCKTADQVKANIDQLARDGYTSLRLYSVDCDQVKNTYAAAKGHNMRLFLGIFDVDDIPNSVDIMASHLDGDWSLVDAVSVGNELVNQNLISPAAINAKVDEARALLQARGYTGPVVTVDTFIAVQNHPLTCASSDFCAVNAHAFFDPTVEPSGAGDWLKREVRRTMDAVGGQKRIVVTETGWPWAGTAISPDSKAVPGVAEQKAALDSIRAVFGGDSMSDVFLFTAYNDDWKDPGPFAIEQCFGIEGPDSGN